MKALHRGLILILFSINSGCHNLNAESPTASECDALIKPFFRLPPAEQVRRFSQIDLNQKYITYICGMRSIHPSTDYLADEFAKEGPAAFPFLAAKLKETRNDGSFLDILRIFSEMQRSKTYNVVAEKDLMLFMKKHASELQDKAVQEYTQELISDISNQDPHTERSVGHN